MEDRLHEQLKYIKSLPIFNDLDEKDIADMLKLGNIITIMSYEPDEKIITEKRLDRKLFLLIKGKVKITREIIAGDEKKDKHIKTVEGSGHFLGEISALTGRPRTASVTALTKALCVVIDIALLMNTSSQLLERVKNKFYPRFFEILGNRLEDSNEYFAALKQQIEDLEKKVMDLLQEKFQSKLEHQEELRKKNQEIRNLAAKLEDLQSS
ncbi:MAG: cyclic nucleotide-binding domain-containing protein [Candidatus Aminicenantes bacterium]|nr:cyclic nucleotide-binding domain-containing protein [Candidatus Aminicenantes bacterium]